VQFLHGFRFSRTSTRTSRNMGTRVCVAIYVKLSLPFSTAVDWSSYRIIVDVILFLVLECISSILVKNLRFSITSTSTKKARDCRHSNSRPRPRMRIE
jgi:hypothetical protein